jgi:phosphatidate cytidylyltransferase
MLKARILTASILAPLLILAVLYLEEIWFAAAWGLVIALCAWEWSDLSGLSSLLHRVGFVLVTVALMASYQIWAGYALDWLAWPVIVWWFVVSLALRQAPAKLLALRYPLAAKLSVGLLVLVSSWMLMVWSQVNLGRMQVLYLFFLVWLADIAAYFVGKKWGTTKLSPEISPGKTVEGAYGALAVVVVYAVSVGLFLDLDGLKIFDFVMLSALTLLVSIVGDLFESLAKRIRGVKDSGSILPGHGGLLDRVDSLVAAVSIYYGGSVYLEIFFR